MRRQSWWHVVSANSRAKGNARLVLFVLSHHATRNGFVGLPVKLIASFGGVTVWCVRRSINRLLAIREIKLAWRGKGRANDVYQIIVPAINEVDTRRYRVRVIEVPAPQDFPPLRIMEEPEALP